MCEKETESTSGVPNRFNSQMTDLGKNEGSPHSPEKEKKKLSCSERRREIFLTPTHSPKDLGPHSLMMRSWRSHLIPKNFSYLVHKMRTGIPKMFWVIKMGNNIC